jgi:hypothetical protein
MQCGQKHHIKDRSSGETLEDTILSLQLPTAQIKHLSSLENFLHLVLCAKLKELP